MNIYKSLRLSRDMTQKDFAEKLGVTTQAVSDWENGRHEPDKTSIRVIEDAFNVDLVNVKDPNVSIGGGRYTPGEGCYVGARMAYEREKLKKFIPKTEFFQNVMDTLYMEESPKEGLYSAIKTILMGRTGRDLVPLDVSYEDVMHFIYMGIHLWSRPVFNKRRVKHRDVRYHLFDNVESCCGFVDKENISDTEEYALTFLEEIVSIWNRGEGKQEMKEFSTLNLMYNLTILEKHLEGHHSFYSAVYDIVDIHEWDGTIFYNDETLRTILYDIIMDMDKVYFESAKVKAAITPHFKE